MVRSDIAARMAVLASPDVEVVVLVSKGPMDDRRFPRETIGEIVVVDLRDHIATGFVTRSSVEARVGDRVEAHRGF